MATPREILLKQRAKTTLTEEITGLIVSKGKEALQEVQTLKEGRQSEQRKATTKRTGKKAERSNPTAARLLETTADVTAAATERV